MRAGLIPVSRRLPIWGRLQALSPGWRQALVLLALVLFVLAAIFPASGGGAVAKGASASIPSPCELLFCDGSARQGKAADEDPADQVRYVDGVGFVIPGLADRPSSKLSKHF